MSLKKLQELSGVEPDGRFGENTFNAAAKYLGIKTKVRAVHFFAQCAHETGDFTVFEENLNYSASGLRSVFSKYFTADQANQYARNPERIANRVYANRMGNGDEISGDGYLFRGRGALQLTGRNNYQLFSAYVNDENILKDPIPVANEYSFKSAMYFFDKNKLWAKCDLGTDFNVVKIVTRAVNGGLNGLDHRLQLTSKYQGYKWHG